MPFSKSSKNYDRRFNTFFNMLGIIIILIGIINFFKTPTKRVVTIQNDCKKDCIIVFDDDNSTSMLNNSNTFYRKGEKIDVSYDSTTKTSSKYVNPFLVLIICIIVGIFFIHADFDFILLYFFFDRRV
jgi:hypothetical protein